VFAEDYDLRPPSTPSADVYLKESSLFRYLPLRLSGVFCTAASVLNPRRIEEKKPANRMAGLTRKTQATARLVRPDH
jgi:hypothetical protein